MALDPRLLAESPSEPAEMSVDRPSRPVVEGGFAASTRGIGSVIDGAFCAWSVVPGLARVEFTVTLETAEAACLLDLSDGCDGIQVVASVQGVELRRLGSGATRLGWSSAHALRVGHVHEVVVRSDGPSVEVSVDGRSATTALVGPADAWSELAVQASAPGVRIGSVRVIDGWSALEDVLVHPTPAEAVRIELRSRVGALGLAWDAMVDASARPVPFLRSWWLDAIAGQGATIVTVWRGTQLLGGCALERDHVLGVERYRVLGRTLTPDHFDLVANPVDRPAVVDALRSWFARPGARIIDLEGLAEHSLARGALPGSVRAGHTDHARFGRVDAALLERVERRHARTARRLARGDVTYRRVPAGEVDAALDQLMALHEQQFGHRSRLVPHARLFGLAVQAGAHAGDLRVYEARCAHEVVAIEVMGLVAGRACSIQGGRNPAPQYRGVGQIVFAFGVRDLAEAGATHLDLLRGDDPWKSHWSHDVAQILRVRAHSDPHAAGVERLAAVVDWARSRISPARRR
ncbi:MAG: GNAT family N-acetyltransferase [Acidimicrobiia bacterium]